MLDELIKSVRRRDARLTLDPLTLNTNDQVVAHECQGAHCFCRTFTLTGLYHENEVRELTTVAQITREIQKPKTSEHHHQKMIEVRIDERGEEGEKSHKDDMNISVNIKNKNTTQNDRNDQYPNEYPNDQYPDNTECFDTSGNDIRETNNPNNNYNENDQQTRTANATGVTRTASAPTVLELEEKTEKNEPEEAETTEDSTTTVDNDTTYIPKTNVSKSSDVSQVFQASNAPNTSNLYTIFPVDSPIRTEPRSTDSVATTSAVIPIYSIPMDEHGVYPTVYPIYPVVPASETYRPHAGPPLTAPVWTRQPSSHNSQPDRGAKRYTDYRADYASSQNQKWRDSVRMERPSNDSNDWTNGSHRTSWTANRTESQTTSQTITTDRPLSFETPPKTQTPRIDRCYAPLIQQPDFWSCLSCFHSFANARE